MEPQVSTADQSEGYFKEQPSVTENIHPETLEQPPPQFILNAIHIVVACMADYGWYILALVLVTIYALNALLPVWRKWRQQVEDKDLEARTKKNPELFISRQEAMEVARLRFQVQHDELAALEAIKRREREERKLEERLAKQEASLTNAGYRLGNTVQPSTTNGTQKRQGTGSKPEYNPLGGSGGSGGYRAARRSCPGGGCG